MPKNDYPLNIDGFRFLQQRKLVPVSTCWDYQTTEAFSADSARRLLLGLPEDYELSFFDPEARDVEAWIFVRRQGEHYFTMTASMEFSPWAAASFDKLLASLRPAHWFVLRKVRSSRSRFRPFQTTSDMSTLEHWHNHRRS